MQFVVRLLFSPLFFDCFQFDCLHSQVGLDPPIRQGQTRYPYLVMLFTRDDEAEIELKIDEFVIRLLALDFFADIEDK
jgi:hypothetical protein